MSGASREQRESEKRFEAALRKMRSIDKLLWLGELHHLEDVEEDVASIKEDLDAVVRLFKEEIKPQRVANELKRAPRPSPTPKVMCGGVGQVLPHQNPQPLSLLLNSPSRQRAQKDADGKL